MDPYDKWKEHMRRQDLLPRKGTNDTAKKPSNIGQVNGWVPTYVLEGSKWTNYNLTYRINSWPNDSLSKYRTRQIIQQAFGMWAEHTPLKFIEVKKSYYFNI